MPVARFLSETSLEWLARRLRILGYDVCTVHGARLELLFDEARRTERIAITTSARHPRYFADVAVIVVPRDPAAALRWIASRYVPTSASFGRCAACNTTVETRPVSAASGHVPEAIVRTRQWLAHCPGCGRWYWHGSHVDRLCAWFEGVLGRAVAPPRTGDPEAESQ